MEISESQPKISKVVKAYFEHKVDDCERLDKDESAQFQLVDSQNTNLPLKQVSFDVDVA